MGEPVEQGGRHLDVTEDAQPVSEGEIGGDDDRGSLVEPADQVKQELATALREQQVAEFIEHHRGDMGELAGQAPTLLARFSASRLGHYWATQQWYLLYAENNNGLADLSAFKPLTPPRRAFWADPFVVSHQGRRFVFFEECRYRFWGRTTGSRGTIRAVEYLADGTWGEPATVLERDYHVSYPFIFRWNGRHYLLPETSANRTIELYEELEFPLRWRLCRTLMDRVKAVDTTLYQARGRWWMFTCREDQAPPNRDLYLYSSLDPVAGEWTPHPANPIVSNNRYARPAGALFFDGHHAIRPSQDCSRGYGGAIEFRRILRMDEEAYAEEPAERLGPEMIPGTTGIHTWNKGAGLQLADVRRRVARWRLC